MVQILEMTSTLCEAVVLRTLLGALLIGLLLIVNIAGRNVIAPRVRFWLWMLVPVQLLWCVPVSSSLSLLNCLPDRNVTGFQQQTQPQESPQPLESPNNVVAAAFAAGPFESNEEFDDFSRLHAELPKS